VELFTQALHSSSAVELFTEALLFSDVLGYSVKTFLIIENFHYARPNKNI